jgi:hypothetical protein
VIEDDMEVDNPSVPEYSDGPADNPPGDFPPDSSATTSYSTEEVEEDPTVIYDDSWMIQRAQEIYRESTDYLDANITSQWEKNLAHFNNQHAPGSAYTRRNFKRSRTFRPKTRANVKSQEAGLAAAAFATNEFIDIQPEDPRDDAQLISAQINKALLQYRLSKRMPWFLTVMGAYQDTKNYGVCITHQYWSYREDTEVVPAMDEAGGLIIDVDPATGQATPMGEEKVRVREDNLCCDNIPPENFRFSPMCDWRDPVNSSPYILCMFPMFAGEVLEMMEEVDRQGNTRWRSYGLQEILSARRQDTSRTRQAREGNKRVDPALNEMGNEYTTVWVHMNIVRVDGDDMIYWTLGTELVLAEPRLLTDEYPHLRPGQRPFTLGFSNLETHKNYPAGDVELAAGLQQEINDVANQRLDNVKLVLNKRYFVKRGAQVDLEALIRNVPGGGVMMNDPEKDVQTVNTPDVTGSSYQEQDRLSVEMDEVVGGFSQSSVQNSRNLNETVGGMGMMEQSAGAVEDYAIMIFMETWMEPTLRQLVQLVQMYETDEVLMTLAARESKLWQRYGIDKITDELLRQELTVKVNMGIGNTDPVRRVEKLLFGLERTAQLPGMIERMKPMPIADEVFGALGYRDSTRFYMNDDEYAEAVQKAGDQTPPDVQVKLQELQVRQADNEARDQREQAKMELERELGFAKLALEQNLRMEELYGRLGIDKEKIQTIRDQTAVREANTAQELAIKRTQGSGI